AGRAAWQLSPAGPQGPAAPARFPAGEARGARPEFPGDALPTTAAGTDGTRASHPEAGVPRSVPVATVPPGGLAGSPVSGPGAFEAGAGQAPPEPQGARGPGDVPAGEWHKAVESWLREVDLLREGDRHELRLRLVPEHLGPLHVELSHEGAGLRARITVGHTETLALIQRHLDDLRQ